MKGNYIMSSDNQQATAVKRVASPSVNVRFPREDFELIRAAARNQSIPFGSFVRQAAVNAARKLGLDRMDAS